MNFITGELHAAGSGVGIAIDTGLGTATLRLPFESGRLRSISVKNRRRPAAGTDHR